MHKFRERTRDGHCTIHWGLLGPTSRLARSQQYISTKTAKPHLSEHCLSKNSLFKQILAKPEQIPITINSPIKAHPPQKVPLGFFGGTLDQKSNVFGHILVKKLCGFHSVKSLWKLEMSSIQCFRPAPLLENLRYVSYNQIPKVQRGSDR